MGLEKSLDPVISLVVDQNGTEKLLLGLKVMRRLTRRRLVFFALGS